MPIRKYLNQPLTLQQNTAGTDRYGNTVPSTASSVAIVGYLEQLQSVETMTDRDVSVGDWVAYLPADTAVNAQDRIVFGSQTFEVDGEPWQVYNPRIRQVSHLQAKLKVVS